MSEGYIYCFSNESMPNILKIGMTERTPDIRLNEANASDTWRPPTPYKIQFAKKVSDPVTKEKTLHVLLEQYADRIHPKREFFRVSAEEVKKFFDLMDGTMWSNTIIQEDDEEKEDIDEEQPTIIKGCRDMSKCFKNGQHIRHVIGINKIWIGTYDSSRNGIIYNDNFYKSLSGFAGAHYSIDHAARCKDANGWKECECEVDGKWISTYSLPE